MVLIHTNDDKKDLNQLKPKIATTFNVNINQIKLVQESDFVAVLPK